MPEQCTSTTPCAWAPPPVCRLSQPPGRRSLRVSLLMIRSSSACKRRTDKPSATFSKVSAAAERIACTSWRLPRRIGGVDDLVWTAWEGAKAYSRSFKAAGAATRIGVRQRMCRALWAKIPPQPQLSRPGALALSPGTVQTQ